MVQVEKQCRLKRLDKKKQQEIIANYFVNESDPFSKTKSKTQCQIDDNKLVQYRAISFRFNGAERSHG